MKNKNNKKSAQIKIPVNSRRVHFICCKMEPENATVEETSDSDAESETMVAYGEFYMHFPYPTIPPPIDIEDRGLNLYFEKVLGLVKKDNSVLKFRLIVRGTVEEKRLNIEHTFVYLSDEPMDCITKIGDNVEEESENRMLDETKTQSNFVMSRKNVNQPFRYKISIQIDQSLEVQMEAKKTTNYAIKFNDESSSDFVVKCMTAEYCVHQWILADRSEYFAALFRNDSFRENQNKELIIEDFSPGVVGNLLQYIYNGTINIPTFQSSMEIIKYMLRLMQIAHKYNFQELVDTCDSYLAQWYACRLKSACLKKEFIESILKIGIETAGLLEAKKLAAAIFHWKLQTVSNVYDEYWSSLISKNPNFAILSAKTATKECYRKWISQHESWCFDTKQTKMEEDSKNDIAIIVGSFGEMQDAVKCS